MFFQSTMQAPVGQREFAIVNLFRNIGMYDENEDLLGRAYEYFIEQFSRKNSGEFYTPTSIVKAIVAILKPTKVC